MYEDRKKLLCPKCGSMNIKSRTNKLKPTSKEKGAGKKSGSSKLHYCRRCKYKF